jgi:hypothetical protein
MRVRRFVERGTAAWRAEGWRAVRCRLDRLWLTGLRHLLKFDAWHAAAPYSCRPYKRRIVELANSLRLDVAVEVGCGLGDILSRVEARVRFGFDTELAVIQAARWLHPVRTRWIHGDASAVLRRLPRSLRIDCLIMVNWIHNLSPQQLAACLLPLLPRTTYLILDAIDPNGSACYRFKHDFAFLSAFTKRVSVTRVAGEPRSFILFRVVL